MTLPIRITTLFFDLDGTLIHQNPSSLDLLFTILEEHLVPVMSTAHRETQQFMFRYWAKSEELKQDQKMYGELTDEFWLHYLKRKLWAAGLTELQTTDLAPVIQKELLERYKPEVLILDDVRPTLKKLRGLGYKMGLISNRPNPIESEVKEIGFESYFDFCFTSGDVQVAKPDPKIFEHALYLADSSPNISAYIGDNYYTDIIGAQNAGIYPVLFDPDNIFPNAECQIITKIGDLVSGI
jgi:HAD superfamily hydrolase (TIGR01549 family)